jgi:hypothetical protein
LASTDVGRARLVRIDAQRHRNVVHFAVGEQAAGFDLPGIQHLAAQRQDRLQFLVAPRLRRTAGGVALDEKDLVAAGVLALAIGELAGQDRHPRLLALLDLLTGPRARLRRPDGQSR